MSVPASRITVPYERPLRPDGDWVLYWMIAARRTRYNPALERAADLARTLARPLLVVEALSCDPPWASRRVHAFVIAGMRENARALTAGGAMAWPYVEPSLGAGKGLVEALAARACVVITDAFPCLHLPKLVAAMARRVAARVEVVDGCGLLPLALGGAFPSAYTFRRHLQKTLPGVLGEAPVEDPLHGLPAAVPLPADLRARWAPLEGGIDLSTLPLDAGPGVLPLVGGQDAGRRRMEAFLDQLDAYEAHRNDPDAEATSRLSPYLHFGHLSPHEVVGEALRRVGWGRERLGRATGRRGGRAAAGSEQEGGWWGVDPATEGFLDQLVTWRELGFQYTSHRPDYADYRTLPAWALATLDKHAKDPRPYGYDRATLEAGRTHDRVWNAAQAELRATGCMHNYLRMLWGKKVLEWSETPEQAWDTLIELNNRWALDGRDPNSYTGIAWVFGRFDRPWGPERPIFGSVRYMTSPQAERKLEMKQYLKRWA